MMRIVVLVMSVAVSALLLIGCGQNPLGVVPVTGIVTLDGSPLDGATVTFIPKNADACAFAAGTTDNAGKFSLTTAGAGDLMGAQPGEYTATVVKMLADPNAPRAAPTSIEGGKPPSRAGAPPVVKHLTPAKYRSHTTSGLDFKIERGRNAIKIELKSE